MRGGVGVKTSRTARTAIAAMLLGVAIVGAVGLVVVRRAHDTPLTIPSFAPPGEAQPHACEATIQSLVDAAPAQSTVTVPACLARETVTIDKPLTLLGSPGAAIRGSDAWTSWTAADGAWRSSESVPVFETPGFCASGQDCTEPEQVYRDGVPLARMASAPDPDSFALDGTRRVLLGADPSDHLIEVTTRPTWVLIDAPDVTVAGFDMRHAANTPQTGALLNSTNAGGSTVRDNVLSYAHGAAVALDHGSANSIVENDIGYAGQLGIHLGGGNPDDGRDNVIRGNRVHNNNLAGFSPEWEAGGLKATVQTGLVIEDNEFASNAGPGIWCDIYCSAVTIARNRVHDNTHAGIMYEVSSDARIVDNTVWANGSGKPEWGWGAGILISSSGDTEVARNTSAWNQQAAISVVSQERADWPDVQAVGNSVHDNTMAQSRGWLAFWGDDWNGPLLEPGSRNTGFGNHYWPGDASRGGQYHWGRDFDDLAAFEATPGEEDATLLGDEELASVLRAAGVPLTP
jgi:nitrous oxidase accessory protein NosD